MPGGDWDHSKQLARSILRDRAARRRLIAWLLGAAVGMLALGVWVVDGWLAESALRFAIWWGICGVLAVWLLLAGVHDALAVAREEREK